MINPNIFREYDIRGIAEYDLTDENIELIGKAYGTFMCKKGIKTIVVGSDALLSSRKIKNTMIKGICSTGMKLIDLGIAPPLFIHYSLKEHNADGTLMIKRSTNDFRSNSLVSFLGEYPLSNEESIELKEIFIKRDFLKGKGEKIDFHINLNDSNNIRKFLDDNLTNYNATSTSMTRELEIISNDFFYWTLGISAKEYLMFRELLEISGYIFILMPFSEHFLNAYKILKASLGNDCNGFICKRADDFCRSEPILRTIFREMCFAELIIADITGANPNVLIELGLALALKEKVIIISQLIENVPFNIQHIRICSYQNNDVNGKILTKKIYRIINEIFALNTIYSN